MSVPAKTFQRQASYHGEIAETWESIFSRIGERLRRNRARCPLHDGDSPFSFSVNETKGVFYCHACGAKGDKIDFVRQLHKCDFKGALRFYGLEPGQPPTPDPAAERRRRAKAGLQAWAKRKGRQVREEHYNRSRIELCARRRLERDPEDPLGWSLLQVAYDGTPLSELEQLHDLLIGRDFEQMEAYRLLGGAAE